MKVTVKYGPDSHDHESINPPTVGALKINESLRAILGFGDNVRALVDGVEQSNNVLLYDGAVVRFETACNTKATS